MRPQHVSLLFVALSFGGCADVERQWAMDHEDRLIVLEGLCRTYGHVAGSSQFVRCVQMKDEDRRERGQAEPNETVEVARADGTTYSKQPDHAGPPHIGVECGTMQDGQYGCVTQ